MSIGPANLGVARRERYASDVAYRERQKGNARNYRIRNKEKSRESSRKSYMANRASRIAKSREYVTSNPERARDQRRRYYVKNRPSILHKGRLQRVGLSSSDFDAMLVKQNSVCAICKNSNNGRSLVIDHCHKTNVVRGLLCSACNSGIGLLKDNAQILESAVRYLQEPRPTQGKIINAEFRLSAVGF